MASPGNARCSGKRRPDEAPLPPRYLLVPSLAAGLLAASSTPDAQAPATTTFIVELSPAADQARPGIRGRIAAAGALADTVAADTARSQAIHEGIDRIWRDVSPAEASVTAMVTALGGRRVSVLRASGIAIYHAPEAALAALQAHPGVRAAYPDRMLTPQLAVATASMGLPAFWNAGFTGGPVDVAIVDSGLAIGHEAFASRGASILCAIYHDAARTRPSYDDVPTSCDDFAGHGTAVGGMVFSQGTAAQPAFRGTAFGIDKLYNLKAAFHIHNGTAGLMLSDAYTAMDASLLFADPPEVINVSYAATATTDDSPLGRYYDSLVTTFGTVVTLAAGNSGTASIADNVTAYNALVVGNIADQGTTDRGDDVIAVSSSRGPSPGGRKKPDIVAPGSDVPLPYFQGGFTPATGTSFAAPAIAGAAALLIQSGTSDARAVKAVLINTADDYGDAGWDPAYGWGYYNGVRAFAERHLVRMGTVTGLGGATPVRFYELASGSAAKATLVWNRQVTHTSTTPPDSAFLANIDLRLYSRDAGTLRSEAASTIDNVEQVTSAAAGASVIAVGAGAAFPGDETFALAHNLALSERQGPRLTVTPAAVPPVLAPGAEVIVSATLRNAGDLPAHAPRLGIAVPAGYVLVTGAATQAVPGSLQPGASAVASWTLRAPSASPGPSTLSFSADSMSFGWVFSASASTSISVFGPTDADGDGLPTTWETEFGLDPSSSAGVDGASGDPDGDGRTNAQELADGTHPRGFFTRYLAEGATGSFFDTRLALVAPDAPARILARFVKDDGTVVAQSIPLPMATRLTLDPKSIAGLASAAFATVFESDTLVIADRTMTWSATGYGSHAETALPAASRTWYLAEGSTSGRFDLFYLLQNPGSVAATVRVTYLLPFRQPPIVKDYTLRPSSRTNIYVDLEGGLLANTDVSAVIESSIPIIVERAMYASAPGQPFAAGHESAGVTAPATRWFLAEGATGPFFDMFILMANPNPFPVTVSVDYLRLGGAPLTKQYTVAASSRFTVWVDDEELPAGSGVKPLANVAVSASLTASSPIIVERTMWWPGPELGPDYWYEAHNSAGATSTGTRWALAEGAVGGAGAEETYVLIANTSTFAGAATVTLLFEDGTSAQRAYPLAAASRTNVAIGPDFPGAANRRFATIVESAGAQPAQIVVERAMYSSASGVVWAAGTNALGTRLR